MKGEEERSWAWVIVNSDATRREKIIDLKRLNAMQLITDEQLCTLITALKGERREGETRGRRSH
jgi:hypothetical protein